MKEQDSILKAGGVSYVLSFILITTCFALWGFANDITNPMVKAFSKIFRMSVTQGSLVQVAFYGGYFCLALPAALFIPQFSHTARAPRGPGVPPQGPFRFLPAKSVGVYGFFLIAYFIMTCGLSFLETSCNPYILSMGSEETSTRRLNFAQCFNPIGSLMGMYVAMNFIQARLHPASTAERALLDDTGFEAMKQADLNVLTGPYWVVGIVIIVMFVLILVARMPKNADQDHDMHIVPVLGRLLHRPRYWEGVIAQFFYVGVQIMCWTFIIQYGTRVFMAEGMDEQSAEVLSQTYNIIAMVLFVSCRFLCTWLMKYLQPPKLLTIFAIGGMIATAGVIFLQNRLGLYCLVAVSGFMSLMFPTIYGIALGGLGDDAKFGAAGLIMAILGGSVLPPLQAWIIDKGTVGFLPAVNASFILPFICFIVVFLYGVRSTKVHLAQK